MDFQIFSINSIQKLEYLIEKSIILKPIIKRKNSQFLYNRGLYKKNKNFNYCPFYFLHINKMFL